MPWTLCNGRISNAIGQSVSAEDAVKEGNRLEAEVERRTNAIPHSVFCRLVSCGMPEDANDAEQGQWFFEWLLKRKAELERLQDHITVLEANLGNPVVAAILREQAADAVKGE